ncbi:MAG: prepilin-type N-terminal cleavage/methylation domain-containing protein [Candidatus Omnitrophica bacterium]|nr:prepilin-type N-terminal cleavage/methylation domain-containing protein [Candidatus Omnitrophota bacterium]
MERIKLFRTGFTLIELLIVIIIIGILTGIGIPQYQKAKENALNSEAKANLKLIQAGQKIYHMEHVVYYNCTGAWTSDQETCINTNLKLALPKGGASDTPNWDYETRSSDGCAQCRRRGADNRTWRIRIADEKATTGGC